MNFEISEKTAAGSRGFQGEDKVARLARMRKFWSEPVNAALVAVGTILAAMFDKTRTVAQALMDGESVPVETIGPFTTAKGTILTLKSSAPWLCPVCHSAHGSNIGVSPKLDAKLLAANRFYFRPSDGALFTISATCYAEYVEGLQMKTRVKTVKEWQVLATVKPVVPPTGKK